MNKKWDKKIDNPKFRRLYIPDVWSHVYGFSSFIGLIITIIITFFAFNNKSNNEDYQFTLISLLVTLGFVILIFFISVIYYNNRIKKLGEIPSDYHFYREQFESKEIIINQIAECSHIITHYFRNLDYTFQDILAKQEDNISNEEVLHAINIFDYFLINITTNLQSYFSQITNDNCSITIKLLNVESKEPYEVKTYFRDPVNFKKRRQTDDIHGTCYVDENTAFSIIMNPNYKNIYFFDDDLHSLHSNHSYKNPNPEWYNLYKSTLVVPISIVVAKNERLVLGFLSVDNFKGGLAVNSNKEYLFFVADLLYLAFDKFDRITKIAKNKNITNEKIDRYTKWN
jgi:hypothetical protein